MPIEIETIEMTDQLDEAAAKSNGNFANIKDRLFGENPLGGHCHDGQGSSAIDHANLTDKGTLSHTQIDQKISGLEPHANSGTLHSTSNERAAWSSTAQEVINARTSTVYGQYPSLDARLEFIETSVAPDAHDQMTDRHTTATGSSDNGSRHKAVAIWDETRNQTLQETLDNIEGGVVPDDSFVKSGIATIDGVSTEQTFRNRYNWLLRNLPENQLWNGSFSYQGIQNNNPQTYRPVGGVGFSVSNSDFKNGIPGWIFETQALSDVLRSGIGPGDEDFFIHPVTGYDRMLLWLTSAVPIDTSTKFHSYPMLLKNDTLYTFNCYHFCQTTPFTCTLNVKIQYSQSDGTWNDITSVNFTTEFGKVKHDSYAFTSHNYTGSKHGYHRILISPVSTTHEEVFDLVIHEMSVYEGNLESNNHKVLTNRESKNLSLGDKKHYVNAVLGNKCFTKSILQRANIEYDQELGEYEFQIPKTAYLNRFEVSTSYNQMFDIGKQNALEAPAFTSGNVTANTSGGALADGTYYYTITTVNGFGESTPSVTIAVTISGGNGSGSVDFDLTGLLGNATAIRIFRGTNSGQETFIGQTSDNSWTDTGNNPNASSQMPPEIPTARLAKYVPYSIDLDAAQDFEDGNLTTLPLSLVGPKEDTSGYIWIKTQYWPSSLDVPTWT